MARQDLRNHEVAMRVLGTIEAVDAHAQTIFHSSNRYRHLEADNGTRAVFCSELAPSTWEANISILSFSPELGGPYRQASTTPNDAVHWVSAFRLLRNRLLCELRGRLLLHYRAGGRRSLDMRSCSGRKKARGRARLRLVMTL